MSARTFLLQLRDLLLEIARESDELVEFSADRIDGGFVVLPDLPIRLFSLLIPVHQLELAALEVADLLLVQRDRAEHGLIFGVFLDHGGLLLKPFVFGVQLLDFGFDSLAFKLDLLRRARGGIDFGHGRVALVLELGHLLREQREARFEFPDLQIDPLQFQKSFRPSCRHSVSSRLSVLSRPSAVR